MIKQRIKRKANRSRFLNLSRTLSALLLRVSTLLKLKRLSRHLGLDRVLPLAKRRLTRFVFAGLMAIGFLTFCALSWLPQAAFSQVAGSNTLAWTPRAPLQTTLPTVAPLNLSEAQTVTYNGKLYVFGGFINTAWDATAKSEVYDPATNTWTSIADMPSVLTHSAFVLDGSTVYAIGGYVGNHPGPATAASWKYDIPTNTWSPFVPLPTERGAGAAVILNRKIHYFGGMDRTRTVNQGTHFVLDLNSVNPTWTTLADMPFPRNHLGGVVINGKIYAVGGQYFEEKAVQIQSFLQVYDPATNTWSSLANMPKPRSQHGSGTFVMGGRIITIGGEDAVARAIADVTSYDPATNTWRALSPLPVARRSGVAGDMGDNSIIFSTGWVTNKQTNNTWMGTPAPVTQLRVDTGTFEGSTDGSGNVWNSESGYIGGSIFTISTTNAPGVNQFYRSIHDGFGFTYGLPVSNGSYNLRLHFMEPSSTASGQRRFNVTAEGQQILTNYDIFSRVGRLVPTVETFPINITDGQLDLSFNGVSGAKAIVSGIELLPVAGSSTITKVSGDNQSGTVGTALPSALVVRIQNGSGNPQSGTTVNFSVSGGGSINPASAVTNASGQASTTLTLGAAPGTNTVTASATGIGSVSFTATGTSSAPTNTAPSVNAGADRNITLPTNSTSLTGSATDDDLPAPPAALSYAWSLVSGPGTVSFGTPNAATTVATFSTTGNYTLRLTASDSALSASDDVVVTVNSAPPTTGQTTVYAIDSAATASYVDSTGRTWSADTLFTGGRTTLRTWAAIDNTVNDPLYQSERIENCDGCQFSYTLPVINGDYTVKLHFAEMNFQAAGLRRFNVSLEGQEVLSNYDIFAASGGRYRAKVETFPVSVTDGAININFRGTLSRAKVDAIEVLEDTGHAFLHVVIQDPGLAVDYNSNGFPAVTLNGSTSHTHEPGKQITQLTWREGSTTLGTGGSISPNLSVGAHNISLTIQDNNVPPQTLTKSIALQVYPINAVGGVLAQYFTSTTVPISTLIDNLPTAPTFVEVLPNLRVNPTIDKIGGSQLTTNAVVVLRGNLSITTGGSYTFPSSGGVARRLLINGNLVTGAINLAAGIYPVEARFAVDTIATLPAHVQMSLNGGAAAAIPGQSLTHNQTSALPFINSMPTSGFTGGGNQITLQGLGFFPTNSVQLRWGNTTLTPPAITVTPNAIALTTPAGTGTIPVSVQTPNGVSNAINFTYNNTSIPINFSTQVAATFPANQKPTQAAWGPDGRLYITSFGGTVTVLTFDDTYNVTNTQTITALSGLSNNNIIGIAFNPLDPPGNVRLYVAHSQLFSQYFTSPDGCPTGSFPYNGQVSVLVGPNFSTATPLITGLPVSNYDHGLNGLAFDNQNNLYIAVGSMTNAGIKDCRLGGLPESPLSGGILKAPIAKLNFNGAIQYRETASGIANNDARFGDIVSVVPGVDVTPFADGLRNPFDLVFTTLGKLYGTDNGPNTGFGAASTSATTQSTAEPNEPDEINLLQEGSYYGHPNRNRGRTDARENVYRPGTEPAIAGVYTAPMRTVPSSNNGIDEYRATTFGGQLRGSLIFQQYGSGGVLSYAKLSPDGNSIVGSVTTVPGTQTNGLDALAGPGGAILTTNYDGGNLRVSRPIDASNPTMAAYDIFPFRAKADGQRSFTIGGVGFSGTTTVTIGGLPATITSVSPTRIRGTIPAQATPTGQLVDVVVQSGSLQSTIPQAFQYLP